LRFLFIALQKLRPAFAPINKEKTEELKRALHEVDCVVLAGMPCGDDNLVNITFLSDLADTPVYMLGEWSDFTTGNSLQNAFDVLQERRIPVNSLHELFTGMDSLSEQ